MGTVEYRALGPLAVEADGSTLKLGGPRQRMVLAVLLSRANHTVSQDALMEAVWAGEPPEAAKSTLQTYIYSLRRELGTEAILRQGDGYRVEVDSDSFDVLNFEKLLERGQRLGGDDARGARAALAQALGLWFGSPYGGLDSIPDLAGEVARLEELRLVAVESRIAADLDLGSHAAVIGELESLIREFPLRERFRAQLMLALYRSERQAEALRAYQQARTYLAEELGIDPSSELRDLEQRILDQDPGLRLETDSVMDHLAFLFTDVEDSTILWEVHPTLAQAALDRQDEIITAVVENHGGTVFKRTGDGLYAHFASHHDAIAAASESQTSLAFTDWGDLKAVKVRMAVVQGEVEIRAGDCFGPTLHRAARVLALGHGGQVLLSEDVAADLPDDQTRPVGEHRLRGIGVPETLHQLVVLGLADEFPALRTDRPSSSMPFVDEGRTVRGYELRSPLGEGDFGVVYRAYQPSLGREVAVKMIRPEHANRLAFVRRFEREAQTVAQLEHPNILPLFDYWRDPDGAYLVMPVMRGGSLADALRRGGWNLAPALRLLEQVGGALGYAHRKGVIHRDLKPGNVLLDEEGNAYLSDFGIATRLTDNAETPVMTSLGFVPPEELAGEPHTFRSDIFSLGVLTFQLVTGVVPGADLPLPPLNEARPGLPPELAAVVARATAEKPADRFERVEDFLRSIRQAVGSDVVAVADPEETPRPEAIRNPYKGLRAFTESDAIDFHGRMALVDELLGEVASSNLVTLVGSSGSGKSSVVRAGLIPALRAGGIPGSRHWLFADMYPGSYPFEELEAALLSIAIDHPGDLLTELTEPHGLLRVTKRILPGDDSTLFLFIDQFEELFSAVRSEATRRQFLDNLTAVASDERSRVRIVLTMRADFFNRPLEYGEFAGALGQGMVTVGPPTKDGLAQAIAAPARAVGVDLDPGLVGRIITDVENQPGGLPLLQYALTEMFSQRQDDTLTISGYEKTGGVLGALGRRAEEIYAGLSASGQEAARQLFLRLVTVDETAADTRRRARQTELKTLEVDQAALDEALRSYGAFRLVSFDRDPVTRGPTVEVSHEALLTEWIRLKGWIDEQRESLVHARRLGISTQEWLEADRDPSFLLRGTRLTQIEEWRQTSPVALTSEEVGYVEASVAQRSSDEAAGRRRRRRTVVGLAAGLVLVAALAVVALIQRDIAEGEARDARARQLAGESRLALGEDTERAILIALEAVDVSRRAGEQPLPGAIGALQEAVQSSRLIHRIGGLASAGFPLKADPSGEWLAAPMADSQDPAAPVHLELVDPLDGGRLRLSGPQGHMPWEAAASPDGAIIAVAYAKDANAAYESVLLFDPNTGTETRRLPWPDDAGIVMWLYFSPDGRRLAASSPKDVIVWHVATGELTDRFDVDFAYTGVREPAAFWVDTETLIYRDLDGDLASYSVTADTEVGSLALGKVLTIFGVSPDLTRVAVGTADERLQVYDVGTKKRLTDIDVGTVGVRAFDWSPDSTRFAYSGFDPIVYVADVLTEEAIRLPGSDDNIQSVEFLTDDLVANIDSEEVLVWDVSPDGHPDLNMVHPRSGPAWSYRMSDDLLATMTSPGDTFELIDIETGALLAILPDQLVTETTGVRLASPDFSLIGSFDSRPPYRSSVLQLPSLEKVAEFEDCRSPINFSPDNRFVVVSGRQCPGSPAQGVAEVIELSSGRVVREIAEPFVFAAEFNPPGDFEGGRYLAVSAWNVVTVYDLQDGTIVRELDQAAFGGRAMFVPFFDSRGRYLVGGTAQGRVWVADMPRLVEGASLDEAIVFNKEAHTGAAPVPAVTSGGLVATAAFDGWVRIWDLHTDELVAEFQSTMPTPFVRFSPDETYLVYPDGDNLARFYLDPDALVDLAHRRLTRDMTQDECLRYRSPERCDASEDSEDAA